MFTFREQVELVNKVLHAIQHLPEKNQRRTGKNQRKKMWITCGKNKKKKKIKKFCVSKLFVSLILSINQKLGTEQNPNTNDYE